MQTFPVLGWNCGVTIHQVIIATFYYITKFSSNKRIFAVKAENYARDSYPANHFLGDKHEDFSPLYGGEV